MDTGMGVNRPSTDLMEYMEALTARLRFVRVCCGDWSRVVTAGALAHGSAVGVFLDPPYDPQLRNDSLYNTDEMGLSDAVRVWCVENGDNPRYRIALCGYDGEHNELEARGWSVVAWKANGGYSNFGNSHGGNNQNKHKERIWFSPYCLQPEDEEAQTLSLL